MEAILLICIFVRPYKRRNTRGSITKNNRRVDIAKIHLHAKFELKIIRQEMQLLERTQECDAAAADEAAAAAAAAKRCWIQSIQYLPGDTIIALTKSFD